MVRAGVAGAENARVAPKNCNLIPLEMEVKCSKLTDLFGAEVHTPAGAAAPGDERVEAYMLSNVSLGLARLHFETCPKQSRKRFYIECDVT